MTAIEILRLVATTEFRPFTKTDWMGFAGCESEEPMIGQVGDLTIVVDGELIVVVDEDGEQYSARVEREDY
jgi:hypothetical protein